MKTGRLVNTIIVMLIQTIFHSKNSFMLILLSRSLRSVLLNAKSANSTTTICNGVI